MKKNGKNYESFKPYYKWIIFNILKVGSSIFLVVVAIVLNLIING